MPGHAGVVASGTATLEAACLGLPYCLVYKVAWLTAVAVVARRVMSVKYLGIVNVIAGREVVKEIAPGARQRRIGRGGTRGAPRRCRGPLAAAVRSRRSRRHPREGGSHRRAAEAVAGAWG